MSRSMVRKRQVAWATDRRLAVDPRGYVTSLDSNLYAPLAETTRNGFEAADGAELRDSGARPAKMRALHSSSALAVNVFDFWTTRDKAPLAAALNLLTPITDVGFERKLETGLPGNPPNLDLILSGASGAVLAIESKFTEWMTRKAKKPAPFKEKYFDKKIELWRDACLDKAQVLAEDIQKGRKGFDYLDAPQLLKHALGMAKQITPPAKLLYLYFDDSTSAGSRHAAEVADFGNLVDDRLGFRADTYQALFSRLRSSAPAHAGPYLAYLEQRYFRRDA